MSTLAPTQAPQPSHQRELVLVGGGHTHIQVLRRFAMAPPQATRLTVVVDDPVAVYSGMVPGFVAGQYRREELEIDVVPLARRAGARVILAAATRIDAHERRIHLEGRPPVPYDLASFDIGSTVAGLDLPGVAEHALASRPIGSLVEKLGAFLRRARGQGQNRALRVVVVGAGAGGVELAFTLRHRLRAGSGSDGFSVTLVQGEERLLPGASAGLARRAERAAQRQGIDILTGRRVSRVTGDAVHFDGGLDPGDDRLPSDATVWVTGAQAGPLFLASGLPVEDRGFVRTRDTLQVEGHDDLFAVGDCATLSAYPETPKAGVYAVRQGPVLIDNLRRALAGGKLRTYRPQNDFLTLLNLGDGRALGSKRRASFQGRWVMRWKDRIDRRFMDRFQLLDAAGVPTEAGRRSDARMAAGESPEMLCGGCAAKLAQPVLQRALARLAEEVGPAPADASVVLGLDPPDDAAAFRTPGGGLLATTLDAFRAFADDPFLVGQVAAVNAASDLLAKGVAPRHGLALVAIPQDLAEPAAEETLVQLLAGARQVFDRMGVSLVGGHTTTAPELLVGFSLTGFAADEGALLTQGGLRSGQRLILTKGLGTGVLLHADMMGRLPGRWLQRAIRSMLRSNALAVEIAAGCGARAVTDVTGFGLAGHLGEMLRTSGVGADLDLDSLPALRGAPELLAQGLRSTFHAANAQGRRGLVIDPTAAAHPKVELLFDPQTSGGLLFGVNRERAPEALGLLHEAGDRHAAVIGRVVPAGEAGANAPRISVAAGTPSELRD